MGEGCNILNANEYYCNWPAKRPWYRAGGGYNTPRHMSKKQDGQIRLIIFLVRTEAAIK